ncbi:MAG: hypothetical protein Q8R11_01475 [bacterium]|nr:hypothetical protein [bacterium]
MELKDRILPPKPLPPAVESIVGSEAAQRRDLVMTFQFHLGSMLMILAGKGGPDPGDPGEMIFDAARLALEAKQAGLDDIAERFGNISRVCGEKWLRLNGSGNR